MTPSLDLGAGCEIEGDGAWELSEAQTICAAMRQIAEGCPNMEEDLQFLWQGAHILKGDSISMNATNTSGSWDDGQMKINPSILDELAELRATIREEWAHMWGHGILDDDHAEVHDWAETNSCDPPKHDGPELD